MQAFARAGRRERQGGAGLADTKMKARLLALCSIQFSTDHMRQQLGITKDHNVDGLHAEMQASTTDVLAMYSGSALRFAHREKSSQKAKRVASAVRRPTICGAKLEQIMVVSVDFSRAQWLAVAGVLYDIAGALILARALMWARPQDFAGQTGRSCLKATR
jgi:hypothetical protein